LFFLASEFPRRRRLGSAGAFLLLFFLSFSLFFSLLFFVVG